MPHPIYLDYNASTPVPPRVRDAVVGALDEGFGNPSAAHAFGRRAREIVERGRAQVAALLGAEPDEIVLTGGGTEANNLALRGLLDERGGGGAGALATTTIEHPATLAPAAVLERAGVRVARVPPGPEGCVDPARVAAALDAARGIPALVSVILAQNETGVLQPIAEIAERARARGALVHADAAQAVGKIRVDVNELGVDLLSVAGHKLYAPKGVGALYVRRGVALRPVLAGAGHERGLRPGTENVAGIAGLGEAAAMAMETLEEEARRQRRLRDELTARLTAGGFVVHGAGVPRLPNTVNGRFPGVRGSALLAAVGEEVAFSTGSACHAGEERASPVLLAMGIAEEDALGAIRLSLGRQTTEDEIGRISEVLLAAAASLRG
ncbi:MAG: cysteine desulfurase [Polyangiaceae bacterium]|nr:cysteine desulfurase [Polyangiaceae bacterium]